MKAIVFTQYGSPDVLQLKEIEKPVPKENEVLIKIHSASVNAADWHLLRADPFLVRFMTGLMKPNFNILGCDIAGTVESVGAGVKQLRPGDAVVADVSICGWGGFAEYVCAEEKAAVVKPAKVSFEDAASVPVASITALQALRDTGKIQPGQSVLINGASGGVGTFAVQLAKYFGAEVTGVCSSSKMDMVRSLGADVVIDYTKEDFTLSGKQYDLIVAANGFHPIAAYRRSLKTKGTYVMTGGTTSQMFQAMLLGPLFSRSGGQRMVNQMARPNQKDLSFMMELLENGSVKPVIDRRYSLQQVPDAVRYVEEGHAKGKVIITM